ncbi:fimbrial protein, partial [Aeromonas salmonicida]|uniref:fimbrial protein n=1 Tax=Aeromonas salmonicida TaxID=645 RepID=UPI003BF4CBA8
MNANKILVAMGVGSMLLCGSAVAAGGAGSGKVTFNGEIINAPCSVAPESVDQVVEMGQISTKELVKGGEWRCFLNRCSLNGSNLKTSDL